MLTLPLTQHIRVCTGEEYCVEYVLCGLLFHLFFSHHYLLID